MMSTATAEVASDLDTSERNTKTMAKMVCTLCRDPLTETSALDHLKTHHYIQNESALKTLVQLSIISSSDPSNLELSNNDDKSGFGVKKSFNEVDAVDHPISKPSPILSTPSTAASATSPSPRRVVKNKSKIAKSLSSTASTSSPPPLKKTDSLYEPGEIVLAHLRGYPWWPGLISIYPESGVSYDVRGRYHILFLDVGKSEIAWIPIEEVKRFDSKEYEQYIRSRKKSLVASTLGRMRKAKMCVEECMDWTNKQRIEYFVLSKNTATTLLEQTTATSVSLLRGKSSSARSGRGAKKIPKGNLKVTTATSGAAKRRRKMEESQKSDADDEDPSCSDVEALIDELYK